MTSAMRRRKNRFAQVSNICAFDKKLSLDAKGLMLIVMALPEDWTFYKSWLQKEAGVGRDKMTKILKELEKNGYLIKEPKRSDDGKALSGWEWTFDDEKQLQNTNIKGSSERLKISRSENQSFDKSAPTNKHINKYTNSIKPEQAQDETESHFDVQKTAAWVIAILKKSNDLCLTDEAYIEAKVEEYADRYKRPSRGDALSFAEQAFKQRMAIELRAIKAATARDNFNDAVVVNLQTKASNLRAKVQQFDMPRSTLDKLTDISWAEEGDIFAEMER